MGTGRSGTQQTGTQQTGDTRSGPSGEQRSDQPGNQQSGEQQSGQSGEPTRTPGPPSTSASGEPSPASSPSPVPPVPAAPLAHPVIPGDTLWEIAAAHLAATSRRPRAELGALDIAPYRTRVCMVNRPHLVSGDVGLIYSGEVIELPGI